MVKRAIGKLYTDREGRGRRGRLKAAEIDKQITLNYKPKSRNKTLQYHNIPFTLQTTLDYVLKQSIILISACVLHLVTCLLCERGEEYYYCELTAKNTSQSASYRTHHSI